MSKPHVLPLASPIGARYESISVDSKLVNCFVEQGISEQGYHVYKRPGFTTLYSVAAGAGRGCYYWGAFYYSVVGTTLYKYPGAIAVGTVNGAGKYYFSSCLGATPLLFLNNGIKAYTVSALDVLTDVTPAIIAQAGFPVSATWVPGAVTIDGYTTITDYTSNIWTSSINLPGTWPGNVGIAQIEPDPPVALFKNISYLLCIKQFYTEAFYDAAATPWPYGRVDGAKMNYGCVDGRTVCDVGGDLIWVAQTREGGVAVVVVSAMRATAISTAPIERLLQLANYSGNVYSWAFKCEGHRLYGVTVAASNLTLVYDLKSQIWYQWTDPNGNYLPYSSATVGANKLIIFQHESNGTSLVASITAFSDNGSVFPVDIYTPNFDGGTRHVKALTKLSVFGDQQNNSTLQLRYSDDDYQTWTDAGTVDMSQDDPFWADLGSFKKRAFRFTHQVNGPFRAEKFEALLDVGSL